MGWESRNVSGNWNGSGTGPVARSHHRANRTRSRTVPLRSYRARWSARSGTTGRSEIGVNTGARLRSGTVPVPKLRCEHGLIPFIWNNMRTASISPSLFLMTFFNLIYYRNGNL